MFYTTALILLYLDTHNTALVEDFFLEYTDSLANVYLGDYDKAIIDNNKN